MATRIFGEEEIEAVRRWLDGNQDSASERAVDELRQTIAADYPAKAVIPVGSGTDALQLALFAAGVGPGDEVIVDPMLASGGLAVLNRNAVPVFADIGREDYQIDPESVRTRIGKRTKVIICTHMFGSVCDVDSIVSIARTHGLRVIEDCCHALFSTRNGTFAGMFGDAAAFSFNHRKQLSTGQGGFVLINNQDMVDAAEYETYGRIPGRLFAKHSISSLAAALAIPQWARAKGYVWEDNGLARLYSQAVERCPWLIPQRVPEANWSAYHIWGATFTGDSAGIDYRDFMRVLHEKGGDYILPSVVPDGVFDLPPSPAYAYPAFRGGRINNKKCPVECPHYEGQAAFESGQCPNAEYVVPRMLNTVISAVPSDRVRIYAQALNDTVSDFS